MGQKKRVGEGCQERPVTECSSTAFTFRHHIKEVAARQNRESDDVTLNSSPSAGSVVPPITMPESGNASTLRALLCVLLSPLRGCGDEE